MVSRIKKDATDVYNEAMVRAERTYLKHTKEAWDRAMERYFRVVSLEEAVYRRDATVAEKEYREALKGE